LRVGVFLRQLDEWAERPCVLTIRIAAVGSEVRIAGILRPYFSVQSLHGWALVPPQQHGGFATVKLTELPIAEAALREVVLDGHRRRLRFTATGELVFELERDDAILTPPPRVVRNHRYLYIGGRRRRIPEPWMLQ
jgi:hypothetical protein